ncbi:MAG: glutathione S-transferase family protein [Solirubrobacteraceae bacterium]
MPISHYCEKARWALDRAELPFEERAHVQGVHRFAARRAGGGTTVPVLICPDGVFAESAAIVAYADRHAPAERRLGPGSPALEHELDEGLGPAGRLWMYHAMHGQAALAARYITPTVPAWERRLFRVAFPLVSRFIDRHLGVTDTSAAAAEREVEDTFDRIAARLSDGRPYLCGDRFSATDLTFSALAAAVLVPPQYGVALPQPGELPPAMGARVTAWREHPAGAFALRMFATER